jgi:hypothetical protein
MSRAPCCLSTRIPIPIVHPFINAQSSLTPISSNLPSWKNLLPPAVAHLLRLHHTLSTPSTPSPASGAHGAASQPRNLVLARFSLVAQHHPSPRYSGSGAPNRTTPDATKGASRYSRWGSHSRGYKIGLPLRVVQVFSSLLFICTHSSSTSLSIVDNFEPRSGAEVIPL